MKYLVLSIVLLCGVSRADFLSGATGFTTTKNNHTGKKLPAIINFAVLDRKGGGYGDTWGSRLENFDMHFSPGVDSASAMSPGLDYGAKYVYLYQLTNDGKTISLESAAIRLLIPPRYITSWGYFSNLTFADRKPGTTAWTEVSASNNFGVGDPHAAAGTPSFFVYFPRIVESAAGKDPLISPREVLLGNNAVRASWLGGPLVVPGGRGAIFGFTSDYPPVIDKGSVVYNCGHPGEPPCPPGPTRR